MTNMSDTDTLYDVVVVGAGIEGSATAYQLSKRGVRVLLLEQFPLPHSRGSSHGQSRVTRLAYAEPYYTAMMQYCHDLWEDVQKATNQEVFKKIGFLAIGEMNGKFVKDTIHSMETNNAKHEVLHSDVFGKRYPNLRYGDGWGGVLDPEGGILMAERGLKAYQTLFTKQGGILRDGEPLVRIEPGTIAHVITTKGTYRTKSVVLCCGPWTNKVLRSLKLKLPLAPTRISVCYWQEQVPGTYNAQRLPTFFDMNKKGREIYGLPSEEYPGHVKICLHNGPAIDPDTRDAADSTWAVDVIKDYVKEHFPGLMPEPSVVESCIYTNTPDKDFILDRHPFYKNIIIGAGFSGHGFKLSPAVGLILADLSMNVTPQWDLSYFKHDRFQPSPSIQANL